MVFWVCLDVEGFLLYVIIVMLCILLMNFWVINFEGVCDVFEFIGIFVDNIELENFSIILLNLNFNLWIGLIFVGLIDIVVIR